MRALYLSSMSDELHKGAAGEIFNFARTLRKDQTEPERILWRHLRGKRLGGHKFRRQHPIKNYIADFYCHEARLVIEVDGNIRSQGRRNESYSLQ